MKFLFTTNPLLGHLLPMVPLIRAARAAGHEVRWPPAPTWPPRCTGTGSRCGRSARPSPRCGPNCGDSADDSRASSSGGGTAPRPVRPAGRGPGPPADADGRGLATRRRGARADRDRRLGGGRGQRRGRRRARPRHPRAVPAELAQMVCTMAAEQLGTPNRARAVSPRPTSTRARRRCRRPATPRSPSRCCRSGPRSAWSIPANGCREAHAQPPVRPDDLPDPRHGLQRPGGVGDGPRGGP